MNMASWGHAYDDRYSRRHVSASEGAGGQGQVYFPWAVSRDGQRFLLAQPAGSGATDDVDRKIVVVLNWAAGMSMSIHEY